MARAFPMADFWNTDWLTRSPMFGPLRGIGARLPSIGWPDCALLDALADESGRVVNARGQRLRFVAQGGGPRSFEEGFEPRTYLSGELQVRPLDWHDLFNALVWMAFPTAKAAINARHYESLSAGEPDGRPPARDALTLFDEEGVVVLSSDADLLGLIREFRWKELFWAQRDRVRQRMRFLVFGHALYRKALDPFVGMTGKAILFEVAGDAIGRDMPGLVAEADRRLALHVWDRERMLHGRALHPLPVLGVPGWWPANEREDFYDDASYFRPGRRAAQDQAAGGSSPSM